MIVIHPFSSMVLSFASPFLTNCMEGMERHVMMSYPCHSAHVPMPNCTDAKWLAFRRHTLKGNWDDLWTIYSWYSRMRPGISLFDSVDKHVKQSLLVKSDHFDLIKRVLPHCCISSSTHGYIEKGLYIWELLLLYSEQVVYCRNLSHLYS